jgi:HD-like signal output (HDOD) protein
MPGVVPQLLQSLRTEGFSGTDLARKISNDVVLVAAVVRIANSSLFKSSETITSIEHAILVLGQNGLRQLITSVAFKPIIDLKSGHFTKTIAPKIWEQSEKCAVVNRMLAEGETVDAFEAFLAGLIQHVGLIVSLRIIDQQLSDGKQSIGSAAFCNSLVAYSRKLSVGIGREWHFPDSVIHAIEEQGFNSSSANFSQIGTILMTGDYVSKMHILFSHRRLNEDDPFLVKGLSGKAVECLRELGELNELY